MGIDRAFKQKAEDTAGLFLYKRLLSCVGQVGFGQSAENDPDIYNGTFVSTYGFARLAYHVPTNTLCLVASKTPVNLRGERVDGHIQPTEQGLNRSYIVAAFRLKEDGENAERAGQLSRGALEEFGVDMADKGEKRFRLMAASYDIPAAKGEVAKKAEIFTNGCVTYLLEETEKGYKATFHAAAQHRKGHFVPFTLNEDTVIRNGITKISKVIAQDKDYAAVRAKLNTHWGAVSSRLWDHKSLYEGEGAWFNVKRAGINAVNYVHQNTEAAAVTGILCAGAYGYNPGAGLGATVGATVLHTIAHKLTHDGLHGTLSAYERARQAKARKDINAYPFNEDASDHFKIQTTENMRKVCPKMDLDRFPADEFIWLDAEQSHMLLNHESVENGMQPENLRGHLVNAHLRGFTSTCLTLDKRTQLDIFQSGLVRIVHQPQKGKAVIYGQYRPELCDQEHLRLPNEYARQFKNGIVRMEYDRTGTSFRDSTDLQTGITYKQMLHEMGKVLFRTQPHAPKDVKDQSLKSITDVFLDPRQLISDPYEDTYPVPSDDRQSFALPDVRALD